MHKKSVILQRAAALLLPLGFALAVPAVGAASAQKKSVPAANGAAAPASGELVPAPIPPDAAAHVQQLNGDTAMPELAEKAKGPAVIRAQVMLDRNWFSVGEIDGHFGGNMKRAVSAFQAARGLPVTGKRPCSPSTR